MSQPQSATLDGLPKRFVTAMRTLFDILDDQKSDCVRFSGNHEPRLFSSVLLVSYFPLTHAGCQFN